MIRHKDCPEADENPGVLTRIDVTTYYVCPGFSERGEPDTDGDSVDAYSSEIAVCRECGEELTPDECEPYDPDLETP